MNLNVWNMICPFIAFISFDVCVSSYRVPVMKRGYRMKEHGPSVTQIQPSKNQTTATKNNISFPGWQNKNISQVNPQIKLHNFKGVKRLGVLEKEFIF